MKTLLITVLSLLALLESCNARGAPWTEEEFKIIAKKVWYLVAKNSAVFEFKQIYKGYKMPSPKVNPNSKKVLLKNEKKNLLYMIEGLCDLDP